MELYRKELKLAVIKGLDESRGSSNVPIKLTHETSDEYINYTEQIHIRYLFDNQVKEEILPTNDNGFYIPGKPLSHDGPIELAVHLINGNIELVTNELSFVVKNAPNGTTQVDPSEFTWQQLVDQYVNAKLDTFANKLDLSKFEETVNGSIENQSQNIESFKTEVNANLSNQDKKITDLQNTTKVSLDSQNTKIDNFKSEVNTSLSNQNTSINQTTSAQNSKITTLESRMDTFTRLSEGSTTGDAELQDIRVGANGITYDTAGNAVRGQYSQLKEDLEQFLSITHEKITDNTYIDTTNPFVQIKHDNWQSAIIPCNENNDFFIKGRGGNTKYELWCFVDNNGNIISKSESQCVYNEFHQVSAPIGTKYLIVNTNKEFGVTLEVIKGIILEKNIRDLKDKIEDIDKQGFINVPITFIDGGYLSKENGEVVILQQWKYTDYIPITNALYYVSSDAISSTDYNCLYDEEKKLIGYFDGKESNVYIPNNAKYIRLSCRKTDTMKLFIKSIFYDRFNNDSSFKVCSFNVGLWFDGTRKCSTIEEVNNAIVNWHRFLGDYNPDFLLTEEARIFVDANNTADAYDKLIRFKLPFEWRADRTSDETLEKQMFMYGKYNMQNFKFNVFKSGSGRPFLTFDSVINGKKVNFIVVHLSIESNSEGIRQQDLLELKELMETYEYGVLTGDFNTYNIDEFNIFSQFNMANHGSFGDYDTWHSKSETSTWNECLDNIITTTNLSIQNVKMYTEHKMSDHQPIMAELKFVD